MKGTALNKEPTVPFISIFPDDGLRISAMSFKKVVLPEPFLPTSPTKSPFSILTLIPFRALLIGAEGLL